MAQEVTVIHLDSYYTVAGKVYGPGEHSIDNPQIAAWLLNGVKTKGENERIAREADEARIRASMAANSPMLLNPQTSGENSSGLDAATVQQMIADAIAADRASRNTESLPVNAIETQVEGVSKPANRLQTQ